MSMNDDGTKASNRSTVSAPVSAHLAAVSPATEAMSRRRVLTSGAATLAAGALAGTLTREARAADVPGAVAPRAGSASASGAPHVAQDWLPPAQPGRDYHPVIVPNGAKMPWKVVDGVKVFHMV